MININERFLSGVHCTAYNKNYIDRQYMGSILRKIFARNQIYVLYIVHHKPAELCKSQKWLLSFLPVLNYFFIAENVPGNHRRLYYCFILSSTLPVMNTS
jgi:hypothetical protein